MQNNKNTPSYEMLLEGLNYDPIEVEKYFENTLSSLEKELFSLREKQGNEYQKLYDEYEEKLKLHDDSRYQILKQYLEEYIDLNENKSTSLLKLEDEYFKNKQELINRIEIENELLQRIRHQYAKTGYEAKRVPLSHKREIENQIDKESIRYSNNIFMAKEGVLKNLEFYKLAEKHQEDIKKIIKFLEEFKDYADSLIESNTQTSIESVTNLIDIYIECFEDAKRNLDEVSVYTSRFISIRSSFNSLYNEINKDKSDIHKEHNELRSSIAKEKEREIDNIDAINEYYDALVEANKENKKIIEEERKALISHVKSSFSRLLLLSSIDVDLFAKQDELLSNFYNSLKEINESLVDEYSSSISYGINKTKEAFDAIIETLRYEKEALLNLADDTRKARSMLYFYHKSYTNLSIESKILSLKEYLSYLSTNVKQNKNIDTIIFELLTNDELSKLQLLDLKRMYLTYDEDIEIKKIEYDTKREEIEETKDIEVELLNSKCDLLLLKKDFEIDKLLLENEFKNNVKILDTRKNIDMLRCDYMTAYTRLDNISKVISVKSTDETLEEELIAQIQIQKVLEIAFLEAISRKEQFDDLIADYDSKIEKLNEGMNAKIRYLNNVLEIERNNFTQNKYNLIKESEDRKKKIYPDILDKKKELEKKIDRINESIHSGQEKEINEHKNAKKNIDDAKAKFSSLLDKFKSELDSFKPKDDFSSYNSMVNQDSNLEMLSSTIESLELGAEKILSDLFGDSSSLSYDKNGISKSIKSYMNESSKAKSKTDVDKSFQLLSRSFDENAKMIERKFEKALKKHKPASDKDIEKVVASLGEVREMLIATEATKTSEEIGPYLDNIVEIDRQKELDNQRLSKRLSDYQDSYKKSIETIEKDYKEKLDDINQLKEKSLNQKNTKNADIDELINEAYTSFIQKRDVNIEKHKQENETNNQNIESRTNSLSSQVEKINSEFDANKEKILSLNDDYFNQMTTNSNKVWAFIDERKEYNRQLLDKRIKQHDENRAKYFRELDNNNIVFKDSYDERKEKINSKYEEIKADNLLEFETKFDRLLKDTNSSYEVVAKPVIDFEDAISSLNNKLHQDVLDATNSMSNRTTQLLNELKSKLEGDKE